MPTTDQIEARDLEKLDFEYTGDGSKGSLEHLLCVNGYRIDITEVDVCTIIPDYNTRMSIVIEIPTLQHLLNLIKVLKAEL